MGHLATSSSADDLLRGEIELLLEGKAWDSERAERVSTAWTANAIAEKLDEDLETVTEILTDLTAEGKVTTRRHRTGRRLYKLTDDNHAAWQRFAGPGSHER